MNYPCPNCDEIITTINETPVVHSCNKIRSLPPGVYESLETATGDNGELIQNRITRNITSTTVTVTARRSTEQEILDYLNEIKNS